MSYTQMKNRLFQVFEENNYIGLYRARNQKTECLLEYGDTQIQIAYPGYKAKIINGIVKSYDFRVDIVKPNIRTTLSHPNIITDLYRKVRDNPHLYEDFRTLLYNLSLDNTEDPLNNTSFNGRYLNSNIDNQLINLVGDIHNNTFDDYGRPKVYNYLGNSWDYSIDDLIYSIRWIVLQEDINYPICKGFEGRKMPFARYYEAIYCAINNSHSINEVISRALIHTRPLNWYDFNYSLISEIK